MFRINATIVYFLIVVLFGIIGVAFFSLFVHEISHKHDFRSIAYDGSICIFEFPENFTWGSWLESDIASYTFRYNASSAETVEQQLFISKYTEVKSYFLTIIIIFIFLFSLVMLSIKLVKKENFINNILIKLNNPPSPINSGQKEILPGIPVSQATAANIDEHPMSSGSSGATL